MLVTAAGEATSAHALNAAQPCSQLFCPCAQALPSDSLILLPLTSVHPSPQLDRSVPLGPSGSALTSPGSLLTQAHSPHLVPCCECLGTTPPPQRSGGCALSGVQAAHLQGGVS